MSEDTSMTGAEIVSQQPNTTVPDTFTDAETTTVPESTPIPAEPTPQTTETISPKVQEEVDSRSVYVGNVNFTSTPVQLEEFFHSVGVIERITILFDRFTGIPKGYAYIEFNSEEGAQKAISELDGKVFRNRELKVTAKRTNFPGMSRRARGSSGRFRGRGGYRGSRGGRGFVRGPGSRGRGRGRGRGGFMSVRGVLGNDDDGNGGPTEWNRGGRGRARGRGRERSLPDSQASTAPQPDSISV
ncbi:hypothetical protein PSN45_002319 [Yamadazyma tenuis]|uniref:RNA-binding domain-containing protein n=1 Tax=Candida tenuis (strain ATCC 10573 / BCRC 21748 / CBS 615 / JCM 9827 / NBRC 10315 / NRRL Y-1498 / VKM Y-70) TaxID=590646 RepID=G3BEX0_CANTC|nr:RNA-binding domain-containing protein [Yamadazyma tenuis ATCC 10573]EGV59957.1 RNA-binding domain-containing protein [Yamadazyma tenuis ATCC 10573]WEJ94819.1 hypothetical protein PSN45_002319 [Yamadazyma tenuis]